MADENVNLSRLVPKVLEVMAPVATWLRATFYTFDRNQTEEKGLHDLVSYVDRESEERLLQGLLPLIPGSAVLAEESGAAGDSDWVWVVDPLDGTTNFIHGMPFFCISIGLLFRGKPVAGWIAEAHAGDFFYAWEGGGAWKNGLPIQVASVEQAEKALFATGFPVKQFERIEEVTHAVGQFMQHTRGLRRFGTAAMDLAWTATGKFAGFYEFGLSPWDVAAGAVIVREAGGTVTDFQGGEAWLHGKEICASNGKVHQDMLKLIHPNTTS
jgi:myo-inositol-1(or 4)-monophosphatase